MRILGIIIVIIGIILGIYALSMDTSFQVNYSGVPVRVNNLGLMNARRDYLIIASVLVIFGTLILIFIKPKKSQNHPFVVTLEKAKVAEFKRNYKESLDMYLETLYHLENDYKNKKLDKNTEEGRQKHIRNITEKIESLKKLISEGGTSN